MTGIRVVPGLILSLSALLALKLLGLLAQGGLAVPAVTPAHAETAHSSAPSEDHPSSAVDEKGQGKWPEHLPGRGPRPETVGTPIELGSPSRAERGLLERLAERRAELDRRAEELDLREKLLAATEARMAERIEEMKVLESRIDAAAEKEKEEEAARLKDLVTMYEAMKPKDAAAVFDRLDLSILVEVAGRMNPRKAAAILAAMAPENAGRLIAALAGAAAEAPQPAPSSIESLPKIGPSGPLPAQ